MKKNKFFKIAIWLMIIAILLSGFLTAIVSFL